MHKGKIYAVSRKIKMWVFRMHNGKYLIWKHNRCWFLRMRSGKYHIRSGNIKMCTKV